MAGADQVHDPVIDTDGLGRHLPIGEMGVVLRTGPDDGISERERGLRKPQENETCEEVFP